ncbi:TfoX/Sxy family protein [bacterium]|nr:TfoX/Sxy family protein [bacterium]
MMIVKNQLFWSIAEKLMQQENVEKGTMMGFPCLRYNGNFFACQHHKTDDLIVKLDASRVTELIEHGTGEPFSPNGRVFREWVLIATVDEGLWRKLLAEAKTFVSNT